MRWQTVVSGVLALALLEAATSNVKAAGRVGDLFDAVASGLSHALSPSVAAIPDLRTKSSGGGPTSKHDAQQTSSKTLPDDWSTSAKALYA